MIEKSIALLESTGQSVTEQEETYLDLEGQGAIANFNVPITTALYIGRVLKKHGDALNDSAKALRDSQEKHLAALENSLDASHKQAKSLIHATWVLAGATIFLFIATLPLFFKS
jgi:hypothetical protein